MFFESVGGVADQGAFFLFRVIALLFRIGHAVADKLIAAVADVGRDLRRIIVNGRIHQVARGQTELLEQLENPPDTDAQPIIAPREIAHVRLGAGIGGRVAKSFTKAEMFDI